MPNSIQRVTMHNCVFISFPLLHQPLHCISHHLLSCCNLSPLPNALAQLCCQQPHHCSLHLTSTLFSLQRTYNETRRQVLWKPPTNMPHEDCGLDEFSSREIPCRIEFSSRKFPNRIEFSNEKTHSNENPNRNEANPT